MVQISCCKYVLNVLKLLVLQLVSRVNDELCEVIKLDRLLVSMQMKELVLHLLRDLELLSPDDLEAVIE